MAAAVALSINRLLEFLMARSPYKKSTHVFSTKKGYLGYTRCCGRAITGAVIIVCMGYISLCTCSGIPMKGAIRLLIATAFVQLCAKPEKNPSRIRDDKL